MIDQATIASNKTCRNRGAVGANAIVPRWVAANCDKSRTILDFGCGKDMAHVASLTEKGFAHVSGFEFGLNVTDKHVKNLAPESFDVIYASNVFNTHSNDVMSKDALIQIKNSLKDGGLFVFNLPNKPCKFWFIKSDFFYLVSVIFAVHPVQSDTKGVYTLRRSKDNEQYTI